ncbi:hypothetical protein CHU93_00800 [Sandarakinorhabdus cyanobacteriorum]|uniref:DUF721 domain-containing protein n=2 Tax=Sandarakinorhabdus cyanobacteriorum TaxID=1981098 RepID=A0A255Z763_9SPHN|nr:hypothetical protein CHU93_00800 [Sandarakinorhabdus cyanobacteriorum]
MAKKPSQSTPEKRPEMPRGRTRAIADLVGDVGGVAFRRFGFTQGALIERWPEIVGETYARHCRPLRLRFARGAKEQGTLAIAATGALAPMLRHVEPQIIDRANRILGYAAVARIAIEQGAQAATPPPPPPKPGPLPESARSTLKQIEDPELRATLQSLAEALATSHGPPKIR